MTVEIERKMEASRVKEAVFKQAMERERRVQKKLRAELRAAVKEARAKEKVAARIRRAALSQPKLKRAA